MSLIGGSLARIKMKLTPHSESDYLVIGVEGRIDQMSAATFQESVQTFVTQCQNGHQKLVLDLHGVDYMSSVGLRALMVIARICKAAAVPVVIATLQPIVKEVFDIARFHLVIKCFASREEAIEAIKS